MEPARHFKFCPRCGKPRDECIGSSPFRCAACGFLYYFNPTIAAAGFIFAPDDTVLFVRRAKEPAKGKLAVPGGFVDAGETAEEALRRETREEVNLELADLSFLGTYTNSYNYGDVTYPVLDLFYRARPVHIESAAALDGVESLEWLDPRTVDLGAVAFPSIRNALCFLRESWQTDVLRSQNP
jgi:ADP-ribose pyrophosphatase YjhB (NUDIX family)